MSVCRKRTYQVFNLIVIVIDQVQPDAGQPVTPQPTIIVNQAVPEAPKTNGMGVAGFVLALLVLFLGWVPVLGWILWVLGLIFSVIGVFRTPKGLAIAGLIITFIGLIVLIILGAVFATALAL